MFQLVVAIVLLVIVGAALKLKVDASRGRKEILTRMDETGVLDPEYSPTAELFKEEGVPLVDVDSPPAERVAGPEPIETSGLTALQPQESTSVLTESAAPATNPAEPARASRQPVPTSTERRGLAELLGGFRPPAGLTATGAGTPFETTFVSGVQSVVVIAGLSEEFTRLGCEVTWLEANEAYIQRNGARGVALVQEAPPDAEDAQPGSTIVTLRAQ